MTGEEDFKVNCSACVRTPPYHSIVSVFNVFFLLFIIKSFLIFLTPLRCRPFDTFCLQLWRGILFIWKLNKRKMKKFKTKISFETKKGVNIVKCKRNPDTTMWFYFQFHSESWRCDNKIWIIMLLINTYVCSMYCTGRTFILHWGFSEITKQ